MKHSSTIRNSQHRQRGSVIIFFAFVLVVLLGLGAVAVDVTNIHRVKAELQNAADAAALAGAGHLTDPGAPTGESWNWPAAVTNAKVYANKNVANSALIQQVDAAVETGYWDLDDRSGLYASKASVYARVPAVQATVSLNEPLKLFFAPIWGMFESGLQAKAIAVITAASSGTGMFPFSIGVNTLNYYWDDENNEPAKDEHGDYITFDSGPDKGFVPVYPEGLEDIGMGTWTTLGPKTEGDDDFQNGTNVAMDIIDYGYDGTLQAQTDEQDGSSIQIVPGIRASLVNHVKDLLPLRVNLPVVEIMTKDVVNDDQQIVGFAGFLITEVHVQGVHSWITGNFLPPESWAGMNPGSGVDEDNKYSLSRPTLVY